MQDISAYSDEKISLLGHLLPQADYARKLSQELDQVKQENARLAQSSADSSNTIESLKGELVAQASVLAESDRARNDLQKANDALISELKGTSSHHARYLPTLVRVLTGFRLLQIKQTS